MITGHLGIAGALRGAVRRPPSTELLLALLAASVAPDILDVAYAITGFCNPFGLFSHTVPAVALEAAVIGGVAFLATESVATAALFVTVVGVHVFGDLITGHKLFWPGGELVGVHLYTRAVLDWMLETPIALAGWWMLRRSGGAPRWAASTMAALALVIGQTGFDYYAFTHIRGVKPNACSQETPALS
ncbi:MAG: metal-dependent hydrolase [bacterium]